ncbi:MAG: phospholipase D family protein [Methylophilaceae bacterium]
MILSGTWRWLILALFVLSHNANAFQTSSNAIDPKPIAATGSITIAFTPQQDAAGLIIDAINLAQQQILVQAYSFTHKAIARALINAQQRGVKVSLIADKEQTDHMPYTQIPALAAGGIAVWLDAEHQSAHNKVMLIDAESPHAVVITGSFNFTAAAQYKNAENLLLLRGNPALTKRYQLNWQQHLLHSTPF